MILKADLSYSWNLPRMNGCIYSIVTCLNNIFKNCCQPGYKNLHDMTQLAHTLQTPIGQAITAGDVDSVNRLVSKGTGILYKDRVRKKGICITGLNVKGVYLFLYLIAVRTL